MKMYKTLNILLVALPLFGQAQKQGNVWYFGKQAGLDFSIGTPTVLTNGQTGTDVPIWSVQEGTASISDSSGNILFYTGGQIVWNRSHIPMPNGSGTMGAHSSTQSSLIVPLPGSDSIFYLFTSDDFQAYSTPPQKGYRYSIVDMCLDSGNGDIIAGQKNILLCDSSTEKLSACEDASGTGYWIIGHKMFSNEFQAWHLTSTGISATVISKIGTIHGWKNSTSTWITGAAQGQMKFNSDGTKLAVAISNFDPAYLDLYDFNKTTGVISNFCHIVIDSVMNKRIYGVEFSPDNSKLYTGAIGGSGGRRLYQFDITAGNGNCDSITASRFQIAQLSASGLLSGMQLAPDGKIYLVGNTSTSLSCINSPNLTGMAANFDSAAIAIAGLNQYTLPAFVAGYKYHNGIACPGEVGINEPNEAAGISVFPNPSNGAVTLKYELPKGEREGEIILYNTQGAEVKRYKVDNTFSDILLDNTQLPAGTYFYQLQTSKGMVGSKKMVVVK